MYDVEFRRTAALDRVEELRLSMGRRKPEPEEERPPRRSSETCVAYERSPASTQTT